MWFKKKKVEKYTRIKSDIEILEEKVFSKYPIHSSIPYLGLSLFVTGHQHYIQAFPTRYAPRPSVPSKIFCEYVDKRNVIRQHTFRTYEVFTLMNNEINSK